SIVVSCLVIHAAHSAHAAAGHRRSFFLFRNLRHERFGGEQQTGDRRGVLQRGARDLGWIDDPRLDQVGVFVSGDVVAFVAFAFLHFLDDERAFLARIVGELTRRLFNGTTHNGDAHFLVGFEALDAVERLLRAQVCYTAACDDAFLNRGTSSVQRIFNARFLLLHLGLGRRADINDGHAAREFGETLLEFFAIVIARRFFDLTTDLRNAAFDIDLLAFAFDNGGVLLVDGGALGPAKIFELHVLELDAEIFRDATTTGQHRNVFQHRLATIAEAGRLDRADLQCAAQFVHDQR